ncbi:hypothetical protein FRC14_003460 [Serendipita sp. 396]|nr:hypothetical protein FRC14_003460 [Serendipita sp. 396]KAG8837227.1 hypothetical protein FRC18_009747 [Serendipita sp. 400]KAG8858480.1 hypothetical protein FRB91_009703 [Serendipita sp. 411]KAG8876229.1 hypothetical protein FRC20_002201 [Serendipita sp. 405]
MSPVFSRDDADFRLRSSDNVLFLVHRSILSMASEVFSTMLSVPQPLQNSLLELPCVELAETAITLELLLMFIYPSTKSPCFLSFNQYAEVLEAASKYAVEPTIEALRTLLLSPRIDVERNSTLIRPSLAESDPLRAFAIATSMGWRAEIIHCSTLTLRVNLNTAPSSSELENMPTKYYRWLGELHEERRAFFRRLFEEFDDEPSEYRVKKCKECGEDPLSSWWDEYIKRATTSVSSRPLGDRVFDLSMLFPPEQDFDDGRCMACPSTAIPLNTLYALSKLQNKHGKKKDSIRHKFVSNT